MQKKSDTFQQVSADVLRRFSVDPQISEDTATLVDYFQRAVAAHAGLPAVTSLGRTLSYRQLGELATRFAAYLQQHTDLQPGDRIAIQMPNLVQYPVVMFGALMAGLVVVNTNPLYSERELEHQLRDSGAKALVVFDQVADTAAHILANTAVRTVIVTGLGDLQSPWRRCALTIYARYIKRMVPKHQPQDAITFAAVMAAGRQDSWRLPVVTADDIAVLQYTGGTTGVAKGAVLSHRNLVANMNQCHGVFKTYGLRDGEETFLLPLPLYHIYTFTMLNLMVTGANHSVLIPDPRNIKGLVRTLYAHPVTALCGINTLFTALCNNQRFQQYDFSAVKSTISGGMALTGETAKRWLDVTGTEVYQGYGLTEASPVVAVNPGGGNKPESVGIALPSTEVGVVSEAGEWLGVDQPGELCVRGPQVMRGYWQQPEETVNVLDSEGWLRTGDIAMIGADGYIRIVDRKKDMIVVSGFKVFPNEIEEVLVQHPDIVEAAAIGIPSEHSGEVVKVFVVSNNPSLTENDVKAYCREELTGYKTPKFVTFLDELPKSNVGKVLRRELRDR